MPQLDRNQQTPVENQRNKTSHQREGSILKTIYIANNRILIFFALSRTISVDQDSRPHTFNLSWSTSRHTYDWWARRQHKAAISTQFVMIGVLLVAVPVIRRCIVQVLAPMCCSSTIVWFGPNLWQPLLSIRPRLALCTTALTDWKGNVWGSPSVHNKGKSTRAQDLKQQFLTNSHNTFYALPTKNQAIRIEETGFLCSKFLCKSQMRVRFLRQRRGSVRPKSDDLA